MFPFHITGNNTHDQYRPSPGTSFVPIDPGPHLEGEVWLTAETDFGSWPFPGLPSFCPEWKKPMFCTALHPLTMENKC